MAARTVATAAGPGRSRRFTTHSGLGLAATVGPGTGAGMPRSIFDRVTGPPGVHLDAHDSNHSYKLHYDILTYNVSSTLINTAIRHNLSIAMYV